MRGSNWRSPAMSTLQVPCYQALTELVKILCKWLCLWQLEICHICSPMGGKFTVPCCTEYGKLRKCLVQTITGHKGPQCLLLVIIMGLSSVIRYAVFPLKEGTRDASPSIPGPISFDVITGMHSLMYPCFGSSPLPASFGGDTEYWNQQKLLWLTYLWSKLWGSALWRVCNMSG